MARSLEARLQRLERTARNRAETEGPPIVHATEEERCKMIRAVCLDRECATAILYLQEDDERREQTAELFASGVLPLPWQDAELVGCLERELSLPEGTLQDNATLERVREALESRNTQGNTLDIPRDDEGRSW